MAYIATLVGLKKYSEIKNRNWDHRNPPSYCGNAMNGEFIIGKLVSYGNGYVTLKTDDGREVFIAGSCLCDYVDVSQ